MKKKWATGQSCIQKWSTTYKIETLIFQPTTAHIANDAITVDKIQDNVALAGSPTTTTQSASDNSTKIATTAYTDAAIAALSDSAPSTLNTLNELAAALGDDLA